MWSKHYKLEACQGCFQSDQPHKAKGLCKPCYQKSKAYVWQRSYQKRNPEAHNARNREWRITSAKVMQLARQRWKENNKDKVLAQKKRRAIRWADDNAAPFCLICGEDRACEWAHIIPYAKGGPIVPWNLFPLCATHHRCYDRHLLTESEYSVLEPYITQAQAIFNHQP